MFHTGLQCLHGLAQEVFSCLVCVLQREMSDGIFTQPPQRESPYLNLQVGGKTHLDVRCQDISVYFPQHATTKHIIVSPKSKDMFICLFFTPIALTLQHELKIALDLVISRLRGQKV